MNYKAAVLGLVKFCACATLALAAFGPRNSCAESPPIEVRTFNVGSIVPLSGALADFGDALRNGFSLAQKKYPERFDRIKFIYEDSGFDAKLSLNALGRLEQRKDINLYYTWGVTPNEALLPVTNAKKLPVIAETSLKSAVKGKAYVVRAAPTGEDAARQLVRILSKRGYKNAGVFLTAIPFYQDIYDSLVKLAAEQGIKVTLISSYSPDDQNFAPKLGLAQQAKYDILGVLLLPDQIISLYKRALELHIKTPTFGAQILNSQVLVDACPDNVEGAFFTGVDIEEDFVREYRKNFPNDNRVDAGSVAYETALLISDLFNHADSTSLSAEEIIKRFESAKPRNGVSGTFAFSETADAGKHFGFPVGVLEVINRKIVPIRD